MPAKEIIKYKVGIVGSTGYTGVALVEILLRHPNFSIEFLGSEQYAGQRFSDVYPAFLGILDKKCEKSEEKNLNKCDLIFYATPNGIAHKTAPKLVKAGKKIVDLSADYRFRDLKTYEKWYDFKRSDKDENAGAIYGLVELKRDEIKAKVSEGLSLIGNPGCYTTASILALAPILKEHATTSSDGICDLSSIIIDAKSGVSGAGRKANLGTSYNEVNDSISPYNLAGKHRHTPELEAFFSEYLNEHSKGRIDEKIELSFSPHLIPMTRGLLATAYIDLTKDLSENQIRKIYESAYGKKGEGEYFVELLEPGIYPHTKWTLGTNRVLIALDYDKRLQRLIITCAIDNLMKGAAAQAVQNMNLLLGLDEKTGLELSPMIP